MIALASTAALWPASAAAQDDRPQITPKDRRAPRKKDAADPRAIALLNLSSDGKVSLVPITILINGKFWDASAYKASPVPMALEPGTVYEAEKDGSSIGLFTIGTALHSNAVNAPVPWLATGAWVPSGADTGKKPLQAEASAVGIGDSDAPPRLTKNPAAASSAPAAGTASGNSSSTTSSSTTSSSTPAASSPPSSSSSGDEPPRLKRPAEPQATPSTSTPDSSPSPQPTGSQQPGSPSSPSTGAGNKTDKPDSKSGGKKNDESSITASDSGADEANRPRLRRGKPVTSFADEDVPGYSKVGAPASPAHGATTNAATNATTASTSKPGPAKPAATVQMIPAISDSAGPDPRSYGFEWLTGEEGERRQQLVALAQEQVRAYVEAQAKATIAPKAVTQKTTTHGSHAAAKKSAAPVLSNVQMTTFDLWSTNQPIVVFSAQAQMPASASAASSAAASSSAASSSSVSSGAASTGEDAPEKRQYSVMLVAYPDIYNNLHKLYVGVTDKFHLDITPRLELVDAVDADGDGRGELLFREISDAGTGWVIYRANADKLWKIYDSLNPE